VIGRPHPLDEVNDTLADGRRLIELEEQARLADTAADEACRRFQRAVFLATSLDVCLALLRGESVPLDRLDQEWVRRYGRRAR
jgi:hypothetical protein